MKILLILIPLLKNLFQKQNNPTADKMLKIQQLKVLNWLIMLQDPLSKQCKQILRKNGLTPIKRLGKGGFGVVYLVTQTDFNSYETQLYSVKCTCKKSFLKKPVLRRYLKQEISLMAGLKHPNIVNLIRTFEDQGWIFMVMEYCSLGNLAAYQKQLPNKVFQLQDAVKIMIEIINGLQHMHDKKIIHRDLKPQNILLTKIQDRKEKITKICDLGFSREVLDEVETFCGTTYYMAPQIFEKKKYDYSVDIWALGVLFFYMLFANIPFNSVNMSIEIKNKCSQQTGFFSLIDFKQKNSNQNIINTNPSIKQEKDRKMLQNLFKSLFKMNPKERISLRQLKQTLLSTQLTEKNANNVLSTPNTLSKKSLKEKSQKQTIESDESNSHSLSVDEDLPYFYIQQVNFVQEIFKQVIRLNFLTDNQVLVLGFYLQKVCLSILETNKHYENYSKEDPLMEKFLKMSKIKKWQQNQYRVGGEIKKNLKDIQIKKFDEVFHESSSNKFQNFKQAYRLVVGHAFYRAHKKIENYRIKNQIKLKLFCCHVINRVFQPNYLQQLFKNYFIWLINVKKCEKKGKFNLPLLKQWIDSEEPGKIIETVEIINAKFYKKNGKY